jgi:hypothetical protein
MKKLTPEEVKGMENELRAIRLARSLRKGHPWLGHVRKTGKKHDDAGADLIIYAYTITGDKPKVLPIALQVKSSVEGVKQFHAKHQDAVDTGIIPIVVNDWRSDERVLRDIARAISKGIFSKGRAERVAEYLDTVRRGSPRRFTREQKVGEGGDVK